MQDEHSQPATPNSHLTIRDFQADDQPAARQLILEGLREHWGEDFIEGQNPDLDDISNHYADSTFLVALKGQHLVGTGALIPEGEGIARVERMSVRLENRRAGIASRLLEALFQRAREGGIHKIVLETTSTWEGAKAFYRDAGFKIVGEWDGDTHFERKVK